MIRKYIVIAGAWASLAVASTAHSQDVLRLGVGGGAAIPLGTFRDLYNTKENVLISLTAGSESSPFGLRLDYSYNEFTSRHVTDGPSHGMHLNIGTADLVFAASGGAVKPYVIAGGGLYNFRDPISAKNSNDFGLNAGVGLTFPIVHAASGFIEARYHRIFGQTVSEQVLPVTVGLLF